jgi:hypothetical protein
MHRPPRSSPRTTRPLPWLGRLLALIALAVQLAAASVVPFAAAATAEGLAAAPICHTSATAIADSNTPAPQRWHDCVLCPLCQTVAHAGAVLGPSLAPLPPPVLVAVRSVVLPPVRAPPLRRVAATGYPRGPPVTV